MFYECLAGTVKLAKLPQPDLQPLMVKAEVDDLAHLILSPVDSNLSSVNVARFYRTLAYDEPLYRKGSDRRV